MELRRHPFRAMGAPCEIRLYADAGAASAAIADIERLERKYSRFLPDSVTSRINESAGDLRGTEVDEETAALLDYADVGHRKSAGRFDISCGVLRRVWDFKSGRLPSQAAIESALELVGWQKLRWERPRLVLPLRGMQIDLGGYVKEYAADRAAAICRDAGVRHGLVDLGGDIAVVGPNPDGSRWRVGIRHPRLPHTAIACVELASGAIATSGDYERFMLLDGVRYCHILSPQTGWPVAGFASVSVIAPHCIVAGTASTITMLAGQREGGAFIRDLGLPHLCVDRALRVSGSLAGPRPQPAPASVSVLG